MDSLNCSLSLMVLDEVIQDEPTMQRDREREAGPAGEGVATRKSGNDCLNNPGARRRISFSSDMRIDGVTSTSFSTPDYSRSGSSPS